MKTLKTYKQLFKESLFESKKVITELDYSDQHLTELPSELPSNLEALYCYNNDLKELPELPSSLERLDCFNNNLKELPELPSSLERLDCFNNNLKELPELPSNLEILWCYDNDLKELPELPSNLKSLSCSLNDLIELPSELPSNLEYLHCVNTGLPFNNLTEYNEWMKEDPDLTLEEKYEKWKRTLKTKEFNI